MFKCRNCSSVNNFGLMLSPSYKGKGEFSHKLNENDEIIINVDGYEFLAGIGFMNSHAVCKFCGEIKIWEYYFPNLKK